MSQNSVSSGVEIKVARDESQALVLRLTGALQGNALSDAELNLRDLSLRSQRPVFFDLSETMSVDEDGVRLLIRLARALHTKHAKLHIVSPNPSVERSLRTANLHTLIPMFANVPQALECLEIA
ncbi:MAG: STAS domain-containing protein [Opitutales bacterium]|nr:STAS domain-containing protein [Opitutales bacterium]